MRRTLIASLIIAMVLSISMTLADKPGEGLTGNGAPKAKLLGKLNIIGVKNDKNLNMDNDGGSTIFVALNDKSKIYLQEGDDFQVLDKNGTDPNGALFQLPDPNLDPYLIDGNYVDVDTESAYTVVVRPLGKPGGLASIRTCADLLDPNFAGLLPNNVWKDIKNDMDEGAYCSVQPVPVEFTTRYKGKSEFMNVTAELLTIVFEVEIGLEGGGSEIVYVRVPIFDDMLENEYWEYVNDGLKLLQVRFYDCPTDIRYADEEYL